MSPLFWIMTPTTTRGVRRRGCVVYRDDILLTGKLFQLLVGKECLYLTLGSHDKVGLLLAYQPPQCQTLSLPGLTDLVSWGWSPPGLQCWWTSAYTVRPGRINLPRIIGQHNLGPVTDNNRAHTSRGPHAGSSFLIRIG